MEINEKLNIYIQSKSVVKSVVSSSGMPNPDLDGKETIEIELKD